MSPLFESAETGEKLSKNEFQEIVPGLRVDLINAQHDLQQARVPVLILIMGDDRLGCDAVFDRLHEWMDARYLDSHVFLELTDEERMRPRFWRYWRATPARGVTGIHMGAWALNAIADRLRGDLTPDGFLKRLDHIREFEQDLVADGALVLKFWLHLPPKQHAKRLAKAKKNPDQSPQLEPSDWEVYRNLEESLAIAEEYVRETDVPPAPWTIVESTDSRYRDVTVARTILDRIVAHLSSGSSSAPAPTMPPLREGENPLDQVDLTATLEYDDYKKKLAKQQTRIVRLTRRAREEKISSVLVFEGWDAAGKGGAIRRITGPMAGRDFKVIRIAAPTEEEKDHHYLWRFWRRLPRAGQVAIFDRSWYGRVLVERVEGFASVAEWSRAYEEIRDFESQLVEHGIPVLKFWLHIDPDEQLRRFQAREKTPYKKYKITDEDYRNREKWDSYVEAVGDMVEQTSTDLAPWTLVPANDKRWARVAVLKAFARRLERALP